MLDPSGGKIALLAGLDLAFFLWYRFRPEHYVLAYHAVLLKYPVFVYLLVPAPAFPELARRSVAMGMVYLAACVYEVLHDTRLRKTPLARRALAVEAVLLGGLGLAAIFHGGKS